MGRASAPLASMRIRSSSFSTLLVLVCIVLVLYTCTIEGAPSSSRSTSSSSTSSFYDFIFSRFASKPKPNSNSNSNPAASLVSRAATDSGMLEVGVACNCTLGESCCYANDRPFCCGPMTSCCGSLCCPMDGVCCRSRTWQGVSSCCSSLQYCTASGDCSAMPINREGDWSLLPLMIGSFVMTFVVCCCTCVCISRVNRRRAMLAAAASNPSLLGNHSTNSAYRTFHVRGSYSRSQGVTAKTLRTFPTQSYHPGCMPAENAQCSICLLEYEPGDRFRTLPCKHHFHQPCIDRWLSDHDTCPLCVQVVTESIRIDK